MFLYENNINL